MPLPLGSCRLNSNISSYVSQGAREADAKTVLNDARIFLGEMLVWKDPGREKLGLAVSSRCGPDSVKGIEREGLVEAGWTALPSKAASAKLLGSPCVWVSQWKDLLPPRMESPIIGREQALDSWCKHSNRLKSVAVRALGRFRPQQKEVCEAHSHGYCTPWS